MGLAAGALSLVSVASTTAKVSSAVATGGTTPYTYAWYRSTTSAFTPGAGNIIAGASGQTLNDSGLIPGTQYYYKTIVTDSAGTPATATSAQLAVATTAPVQNPSAFAQSPQLGMIDLRFDYDTVAVEIDSTQATALSAGAAVKMVDSVDGIPKVVGCAANSDEVLGFINYDVKSQTFAAGDRAEISLSGNVIYLYATGAIARGVQVSLDLSTNGGVRSAAGNTGDKIVGWAYDKAVAGGTLIRVHLKTPSFTVV